MLRRKEKKLAKVNQDNGEGDVIKEDEGIRKI
jgi:hypothetical protein